MEAALTETAAAATFAAESLKAHAGRFGILATVNVKDLAETIAELAGEYEGNVFAASAALQTMDAAEQLEALGLDEDDENSYLAAKYGMAA